MRIAIASRIFSPESGAAAIRLEALAKELFAAGHQVSVITVNPPKSFETQKIMMGFKIRRFPVLRDKSGYVRGYLQYMSFDIPLFFRLIFTKFDVLIVEPPPTTGAVVRVVAKLKRKPYFYYAADIWSDATIQTGAPKMVINVVKRIEIFALKGARALFSVSEQVTKRIKELNVTTSVHTVGNGIDTSKFSFDQKNEIFDNKVFVYTGTASELHGADIFIKALPKVLDEEPLTKIRFIGGGAEVHRLKKLAEDLNVAGSVSFEESISAEQISRVLNSSGVALASLRPGYGYDFAFPTKLYAAASCGNFMIYAGPGPATAFVNTKVDGLPIGIPTAYEPGFVTEAMLRSLKINNEAQRRKIVSEWAKKAVSLRNVSKKIVRILEEQQVL